MATRLSVQCGKPPSEICATYSSRDFAHLHAYYALEPWGFKGLAFLATVIANMSGKTVKKDTTINDFMK